MEVSNILRFDGETVVVTGAGRGLGREYALLFADRGANVVVNNRISPADGERGHFVAQEVVDEITAKGGTAVADTHSISEVGGPEGVTATALDRFGKVDVLVNNAGIRSYGEIDELTDSQWDDMFSVTLGGTYRLCRSVWPHFKAQGGGRIINTISNTGYAGCPSMSHYASAKLSIAGLTKSLALEGREFNIRANAVAPIALTRENSKRFFDGATQGESDWKADIAAGKVPIGPPEIVAPTVAWLAHRETDVTGEIYTSSSGWVARVAFVVGDGYFEPTHTVEDLAANVDQVRRLGSFLEPVGVHDELNEITRRFTGTTTT